MKDSIRTEVRLVPRDTLIVVPKDSISVQVSLEDLGIEPTVAVSQSGDVKASIRKAGENIIVDCDVKELELKLQLLDKEIETLKSKQVIETERVEVPVKFVPWWVKILAWAGGIAIVLIAGKLIFKSIIPF